jgi:hypothetical protein
MAQPRASQLWEEQRAAEPPGQPARRQEPEALRYAWLASPVPEAQLQASPLLEARPGAPAEEPPQLPSFE